MLLDTCIVVDVLRGRASATSFIASLERRPAISTVTIAEIFAHLTSQRAEEGARRFLRECEALSVTPYIAEAAGQAMRHFRKSHDLDIADALIGATAEERGLQLATLNVKHFPMLPRLKPVY